MSLKVKNAAGKALTTSLIYRFVSVIGPLILIPLFVKYLTPEEYGTWLVVLSISSYFFLTNPGITQVVSNAVARDITAEKVDYYSQVASSGYYLFRKITAYVFIAATIVFVLIKIFFTSTFLESSSVPLVITISLILLTYPIYLYRSVLVGLGRIHIEQISALFLGALFRYILTILLLLSGFKLIALSIIYGLSNFLPSLGSKLYLKNLLPRFKISREKRSNKITKNMIKPTTSFFILYISGSFLNSADNIIIASVVEVSSVPMYAVPMQLMWLFVTVVGLFSSTRMPLISGLHKKRKLEELRSLFKTLLFFSSVVAVIVVLNLLLFGETLIVNWAGPEIFPGNDVFYCMLIFTLLFSVVWPSDAILTATEKHSSYAKMTGVEALLNVMLSIYLTYQLGIKGAVIGTIISRLLTNGWFMFYRTLRVIEYKYLDFLAWLFKDIFLPVTVISVLLLSLKYFNVLGIYPLYVHIFVWNLVIFITLFCLSKKNIIEALNSIKQ